MAAKHPNASFRLMLSSVVGIVLALVLPRSWPWEARAMLGWAAFCAINLIRMSQFMKFDGEQTRRLATYEDESRALAATITTVAALFSLVGSFLTLHQAAQARGLEGYLLTGLAVVAVGLSWLLIHAEFTLHYAYRFYTDGAGVQFMQPKTDEPLPNPNVLDFAYLSFTIGMTFQVSDMLLETHRMRRLLLEHALLSYVFSAVIVAVTINALASIIS